MRQSELPPRQLAEMLKKMERDTMMDKGLKAKKMQRTDATQQIVTACEEVAK